MKKIIVVTGTRAEYGILKPLMLELEKLEDFDLNLVVTGTHLSHKFGHTVDLIFKDGFRVADKIDIGISEESEFNITDSLGEVIKGFSATLKKINPDFVIVLGDRFEILGVVQAAIIYGYPVVHLAGGDITEGAYDNSIRNAITKMSHLHFVTNDMSRKRVVKMGESPEFVLNVGSLGLDSIKRVKVLNKVDLARDLNLKFGKKNFLITYHPETIDSTEKNMKDFEELLNAFESLSEDTHLFFTYPNQDKGSGNLIKKMEAFILKREGFYAFKSLGQQYYFSMISACDLVIGNSSSGLYEVPSFKKPTIDIGDRQKGRIRAGSVINVPAKSTEITKAIENGLKLNCDKFANPYGEGNTTDLIIKKIKSIPNFKNLLKKSFYEE